LVMVPFYDSPTSSCAHNMGIQFIKIVSDIGHMTRTKGHVPLYVRMQFSAGYAGNEGPSKRKFAMTVMYRINLHLSNGC
jgi:hypothetical protein